MNIVILVYYQYPGTKPAEPDKTGVQQKPGGGQN